MNSKYLNENTVKGILDVDGKASNEISGEQAVEFEEIAEPDGSENFFLNVNKPKDYKTALTVTAA